MSINTPLQPRGIFENPLFALDPFARAPLPTPLQPRGIFENPLFALDPFARAPLPRPSSPCCYRAHAATDT